MKKFIILIGVLVLVAITASGCDLTDKRKGKNGWDCVTAIDVSGGDDTLVCSIKTSEGNRCYVADSDGGGVAMECEPSKTTKLDEKTKYTAAELRALAKEID